MTVTIIGFDDAAAPDKVGLFLSAQDVISEQYRLNDEAYRFLLKLKIVQNYANHSAKSIEDAINTFFSGEITFKDNFNMTITYFINDVSSALIKAALNKKVLPKPMGVRLEAIKTNNYFGFADATKENIPDYIIGFNDAAAPDKTGRFLDANSDIIA